MIFEGTFKNDFLYKRVKKYADGAVFEGRLGQDANGVSEIKYGTMRTAEGTVFIGNFKNGKLDGKGKMETAEGEVWKGVWKEGEMHGRGMWTKKDGKIVKGRWAQNRLASGGITDYNVGSAIFFKTINDEEDEEAVAPTL